MQFIRKLLRFAKSVALLGHTRAHVAANTAQIDHVQATIRDLFVVIQEMKDPIIVGLLNDVEKLKQDLADGHQQLNTELEAHRAKTFELTTALGQASAAQSTALAVEAALASARDRTFGQKVAATAASLDMLSRHVEAASMSNANIGGSGAAEIMVPLGDAGTTSAGVSAPNITALMDSFYVALEARFRGDVRDIGQRQTIYVPDIKQAVGAGGAKDVLDIGCGRGEWLSLLRTHDITALGIDTNEGQLAVARAEGLAVVHDDALHFLRSQPEGHFAAVTAFHIFEHLPFPVLAEWLGEIRRVLCPGGLLIAETPNPENLIVGANTFHLDPTHTRPLPSGVLEILCETVGLAVSEIRPLHPHGDLKAALADLPERTAYLLYGYQDYGLIAQRPLTTVA